LTDTVLITIHQQPYINAGNDTILTIGVGPNVIVPLNPTGINIQGVKWTSTGTGTFIPSDSSLYAVYAPSKEDFGSDSILITVSTTGTCTSTSDFLVVDFLPLIIPNIFTPYPTSPGENDYFVIKNLTPNTYVNIYDRWGMLVYSSDYYRNDWDAYGLKADVYFYVVTTAEKDYKGWVQIIREE
jgi:gliding motility-associated-like protein